MPVMASEKEKAEIKNPAHSEASFSCPKWKFLTISHAYGKIEVIAIGSASRKIADLDLSKIHFAIEAGNGKHTKNQELESWKFVFRSFDPVPVRVDALHPWTFALSGY